MNVADALKARKSVRAFTSQSVSDELVNELLSVARCAPSGVNSQPWQVAVLRGETKLRVAAAIETAYRNGQPSNQEYHYYPSEWCEPYLQRRKDCGLQLYSALGIKKDDKPRRQDQWAANYRAFDAPVMLLFFIDDVLEKGSYLDYGMFIQSVMLAAMEMGLATCPQAALAEYPDIVKQALGYDKSQLLICGMALGYEDVTAPVNQYRTPRAAVAEFTRFFS
jgi:nitroreductase